jgi:acylphosphatase
VDRKNIVFIIIENYMKKEVYCVVHGDVQGVFFRQFVKEKADSLGVFGYVKNKEDGTVEIVAQGDELVVKNFLESISAGPENAQVESMNVMWGKVEEEYSKFDIL